MDGSIIEGGCACVMIFYGATPCSGSPLAAHWQIGPLQDNGGLTWTMLPGAGGPARCGATCVVGDTDQRGVPRGLGAGQCAVGMRLSTKR